MPVGKPETILVEAAREEKAIARAVEALRAGGLVVLPTDTVYGLAAACANDGERCITRSG